MADETGVDAVELATELTIAWLSNQNNRVHTEDVPAFLQKMHATIVGLSGAPSTPEEDSSAGSGDASEFAPAVSVRRSLASKDHIISMIDGKPYKTLRRHLSRHGLTPEQYRERYNLKSDYPMVAMNYSNQRKELAKKIGLGSKGRVARAANADPASTPAPTRRGRSKSA